MRVLIVDDEPIARQVLREELDAFDDVEVVGEAENGGSALGLIATLHPQLVFVDLEMPVMNGFEMIEHLVGTPAPVIVVVTAYDQHAIRALDAGAIDYLLKPVGQARLAQSLQRARRIAKDPRQVIEHIGQLQAIAPSKPQTAPAAKVVGKLGDDYFLLNMNEVLAFQAEGDLTWIITAKSRYLATQNLRAIQEKLQHSQFQRIHRNALVNVNHVRKMSVLTSQRWLMTLTNGQEFIVSKRQAKNVRPFLAW
jgi:two-component system, LytTR family, response regulator